MTEDFSREKENRNKISNAKCIYFGGTHLSLLIYFGLNFILMFIFSDIFSTEIHSENKLS